MFSILTKFFNEYTPFIINFFSEFKMEILCLVLIFFMLFLLWLSCLYFEDIWEGRTTTFEDLCERLAYFLNLQDQDNLDANKKVTNYNKYFFKTNDDINDSNSRNTKIKHFNEVLKRVNEEALKEVDDAESDSFEQAIEWELEQEREEEFLQELREEREEEEDIDIEDQIDQEEDDLFF